MSKAPERIWAEPGMPGYLDEPNELYTVEYVRADRIEQLAATNEGLEKRNTSLEAVLRNVAAWVDALGLYAQKGHEPVTVFKRVKEVLSSE